MSTFEIVRGVEGDCLVLDDTRICGPKPWGGGHVINTFRTDGIYEVIDKDEYRKMLAENVKLRKLVDILCFCMQVHKQCDDCKLNGAKGELGLGHDPLLACDGLHEMLKELGIEVD